MRIQESVLRLLCLLLVLMVAAVVFWPDAVPFTRLIRLLTSAGTLVGAVAALLGAVSMLRQGTGGDRKRQVLPDAAYPDEPPGLPRYRPTLPWARRGRQGKNRGTTGNSA